MPDAPQIHEPAVVAQKLYRAMACAAEAGYIRFFPDWFEDFTRYAWVRSAHMRRLSVPVEPKEGNGGWAKFRGGSTRFRGDKAKAYRAYRDILLRIGVITVVDEPDAQRRLSGSWRVDLPVPFGGEAGRDEAWRIAREMLKSLEPSGVVPPDEVRKHFRRCRPHVRRGLRRGSGRHASLEHSPRNRHMLDQLRAAVLLAPVARDPKCLVVTRWPDGDECDADVAVFERPAASDPVAVVKCGPGNADDPELHDLVELAERLRDRCGTFIYFTLWEPAPEVLRAAEAAGIEVLYVLPRRAYASKS